MQVTTNALLLGTAVIVAVSAATGYMLGWGSGHIDGREYEYNLLASFYPTIPDTYKSPSGHSGFYINGVLLLMVASIGLKVYLVAVESGWQSAMFVFSASVLAFGGGTVFAMRQSLNSGIH